MRAKREKKEKAKGTGAGPGGSVGGVLAIAAEEGPGGAASKPRKLNKWKLQQRHKELMEEIDSAEARLGELDARFAEPTLYQEVGPEDLRAMEGERTGLQSRLDELVEEWGRVEEDLASLGLSGPEP